ncbi:MAG TPA: type II/IV secretion system protein, partial [Isosphaeraceae bacterium]|nr:type II/IV secretion system protein [Isosphaeraceae bacterium]
MIRPLLVLATVVLTILGAVARADAAELLAPVLAQSPNIVRGPGFYLNLYKFIPVVVIYLLWTWTTDWVEHDTKELNNVKFALWNSVVFFSGVLGLILIFAIPI